MTSLPSENINLLFSGVFRGFRSEALVGNGLRIVLYCFYFIQKQPPEVLYKIGVPKNFAKFKGKTLAEVIFGGFYEILRTPFFYRTPPMAGSVHF